MVEAISLHRWCNEGPAVVVEERFPGESETLHAELTFNPTKGYQRPAPPKAQRKKFRT
jgi:hypothetical protein